MTKKSLFISLGLIVIITSFVFINHLKKASNSNNYNKNNTTYDLSYKRIYMPLGDDSHNNLNNKMIILDDTINSDTNDLAFPVYASNESSSNLSNFLDTIK